MRRVGGAINEARLHALIEASPLGIVITDVRGRPVFYNPKSAELHGRDLEEARGDGWAQALHPDDRDRVVSSWYAAAAAGRPWSETYRFVHRDGRVVWVSGRAAPIRLRHRLVGFVGTLEDITAEREARESAERAIRMRDEVLAMVAHDLRSPLSTILLNANALLAGEWRVDRALEQVRIIHRCAEKMGNLIRDLLDISRIEAGQLAIARSSVDVGLLCREAVELMQAQARERDIALECKLAPGLLRVPGDPGRVSQVLSNLLGNALKFAPSSGRVLLQAQPVAQGVRVSVEDNGPGIPAGIAPRLFERFSQANGAGRGGAGLGLAIAKAIVEAHGGRIWIESAPGRGTRVSFTLPK